MRLFDLVLGWGVPANASLNSFIWDFRRWGDVSDYQKAFARLLHYLRIGA
jgi:hypothetical protein